MGAWETPQAPEIWCCGYSGWIFPGNLDCKPWKIRHFPSTFHLTQNIGSPKAFHKNHRESATRSVNPHNSGQRPMWTTNDRLVTKLGGSGHHRARALADLGLLVHHGRAACRGENFAVEDEQTGAHHFSQPESQPKKDRKLLWIILPQPESLFYLFLGDKIQNQKVVVEMQKHHVDSMSTSKHSPPSSQWIYGHVRMGYHGIPHIAIDYHWCYPLVMSNIAIENDHKNSGFSH